MKSKEDIFSELKSLLAILGHCITSFRDDFQNIDCTNEKNLHSELIQTIVYKIEKMVECAKSLRRLCQLLKGQQICPSCLQTESFEESRHS